ncbi:MAG: hypothetical protein Kow0020_02450 [Wenzhouxiangellaceae bacterium]
MSVYTQGTTTGSTRLVWLLWLLWPACVLLAQTPPAPADLDRRIDAIEQEHFFGDWQSSEAQIDALMAEGWVLSPDQLDRLDLMRIRNRALEGRFSEGVALAEQVLARNPSLTHRLRALQLAANCALHGHEFARSLEYLGAMLELLPSIDDPVVHADTLSLASRIHRLVGEHAMALEYAAESVSWARKSDDLRTICDAHYSLALAQHDAGLLTLALESAQAAWGECQRSRDPIQIAASMTLMGRILHALGRHEAAIGWLQRAIDTYENAPYSSGLALARYELALAYLDHGDHARALAILERLEPEGEGFELVTEDQINDALARAHAAAGQWAQALTHLDRLSGIGGHEEIERNRRLAYLQAEFEARRREQELMLLREQVRQRELEEQAAAVRLRMYGAIALSVVALVLLLLLALVYLSYDRRRFHRISRHDGLTGLLNHRGFHERLEALLDARGADSPVACMIAADIDHFKRINDQHGHQAGDAVLRRAAEQLRKAFPTPAVLGRIGGEEFGIFIPDCNRLQALQRIHSFRMNLRPVVYRGRNIEYTFSFGIAEVRETTRLETLRRLADEALYRAKRGGRNQVVDAADLGLSDHDVAPDT